MTININISNFQEWIFTFILGIEAKIAAIIAAKKLSEELEFYATQVSAFFLVLANLIMQQSHPDLYRSILEIF